MSKPKVLFLDIETAPIQAYTWGLWDQNIALNQIQTDWSILSWAAKWLGSKSVMYEDMQGVKDKSKDKKILKGVWNLIDEADVMVTQNGKAFDVKKLNARFIINQFQPPSDFQHIDTLKLAKKYFGFTSNKLEYMTEQLNTKYKKLKHKEFPGFELWRECLKDNPKAWREMEKYNKHDVLALEELYTKLIPWDGKNTINFNVLNGALSKHVCSCGSSRVGQNGVRNTKSGSYQRLRCNDCGAHYQEKLNLLKGT